MFQPAPGRPRSSSAFCAALLACALALPAGAACRDDLRGLRLEEALRHLQQQGQPIFFSSELVAPELMVAEAPCGEDATALLAALLRPYSLVAQPSVRGRLVVARRAATPAELIGRVRQPSGEAVAGVKLHLEGVEGEVITDEGGRFRFQGLRPGSYRLEARRPGFAIAAYGPFELAPGFNRRQLELVPVPGAEDRIEVLSSALAGDERPGWLLVPAGDGVDLPAASDDWLRATSRLAGVASAETSARPRVQGGRDDELLVVLDGLELLAPYHLQEFDSALSIVPPATVDQVALIKGGYQASYGDRMGGVLEMSTVESARASRLQLALGVLFGEVGASGDFARERGHWLFTGRTGSQRVALEINGRNLDPRYSDVMGKVEFQLRPGQSLRGHLLLSGDSFTQGADADETQPFTERYGTFWGNHYFWLDHAAVVAGDAFLETILSAGRIDRDREGFSDWPGQLFEVVDEREMHSVALQQSGHWVGRRLEWEVGYQLRGLDAEVGYRNRRNLGGFLAPLRTLPAEGKTTLDAHFDFDQVGAYFSSRWRPSAAATLDLGLRYDEIGLTHDQRLSPRVEGVVQLGAGTQLRVAWGFYYQSQRPYELQAEDGETTLARSERAEHRVIDLVQRLPRGWRLRAEVYQRRFAEPRPRYENLFDPQLVFPEFGQDRLLLAASSGRAEGLDLSVQGPVGKPFQWSAGGSWSRVFDRVDGKAVPRTGDQPFALRVDLVYRWGRGERPWSLATSWQWHSGWPTTRVGVRTELGADGQPIYLPELGPRGGDRLSNYHRLDLRLSRRWQLHLGELAAYFDLQNVYDRQNERGYDDLELVFAADGTPRVEVSPSSWGGALPTAGISWRF